jgi:hypothetical protein
MQYPLFIINADDTSVHEVEITWHDNKAGSELPKGPARDAEDHIMKGGGRRACFYHPETGELWALAAVAAGIPDEAVQEVADHYLERDIIEKAADGMIRLVSRSPRWAALSHAEREAARVRLAAGLRLYFPMIESDRTEIESTLLAGGHWSFEVIPARPATAHREFVN